MVIDESGESFEIDYTEKTNKRKAGALWMEAIKLANLKALK